MVRLGEGARDTRRRARLSEIAVAGQSDDDVLRVLNWFAQPDRPLVTIGRALTEPETTVEVAHEALLEQWPELRRWIDENRDDLRFQRQLDEATNEWESSGRMAEFLWWGIRFEQLQNYRKRQSLTASQNSFYAASETAQFRRVRQLREERSRADFDRNLRSTFSLEHLDMHQVSFFGDCEWFLRPGVNVVLGRNGFGKSLILRTLAALLQGDEERSQALLASTC
jgi:ATPase subunit of ABC transporter with duplicated ATPase domains